MWSSVEIVENGGVVCVVCEKITFVYFHECDMELIHSYAMFNDLDQK